MTEITSRETIMFNRCLTKSAQLSEQERRMDGPSVFNWVIAMASAVFVFCSFAYRDLISLTVWSTNVWDVVLDSNIRHLYELSSQNIYGLVHKTMGSELMSVLPWSIWNLPIWAIQRFGGVRIVDSVWMLGWSKLFLVAMTALMLVFTYKLCMLLTGSKTKSHWCVFLSGSSFYTYIAVLNAGQNDIIMIAASVAAIYYLVKGSNWRFYLFSAIAVAIKPFFLIVYVAIILISEKNFIKILLKILMSIIGIVLQKALFFHAPMYAESVSEGPAAGMMGSMFSQDLITGFGPVSIFAVGLAIIYFYAYTRSFEPGDERFGKYVVYVSALTYICYLMFTTITYYRVLLMIPFIYLVLVQNEKLFGYNIILDTAMNLSVMMYMLLGDLPPFWTYWMEKSIIPVVIRQPINLESIHNGPLSYIKANFGMAVSFYPLFCAVAVVCAGLIFFLNSPNSDKRLPYENSRYLKSLVTLRSVIMLPPVLAMFLLAR